MNSVLHLYLNAYTRYDRVIMAKYLSHVTNTLAGMGRHFAGGARGTGKEGG